jgi:hypothetical protein
MAEDHSEGIWGAPPAAYRPQPMLGEGSIVDERPRDPDASSPMQSDVARAYGTAGTGFGAPSPSPHDGGKRSMASLQGNASRSMPAASLIDKLGAGFSA